MENTIDVENYENNGQCIFHGNIDHVLHINGLFRLDAFTYSFGNCLFDPLHVLLHFHYSSIELWNGLIYHVLVYLDNVDKKTMESYDLELRFDFLY